jgi:hypothetical protein
LDICCRRGGATVGYQRAGFYVIGVDIDPQPGYPGDEFVRMDGIELLEVMAEGLMVSRPGAHPLISTLRERPPTLIHQSWPCQDGNTATAGNRARGLADDHQQFIPEARRLSDLIGIPYVIEQPTSSRRDLIRRDLTLCMDMFKGDIPPPWVQKHRSFEVTGFGVPQPVHPRGSIAGHQGYVRGHRHGVVRAGLDAPYVAGYGKGGGKATASELRHAMGIDWMDDRFDLCEAIPPAYSEYIGWEFLRVA